MNSLINSTNVHNCNNCTKISVIVVNTYVCRRSVDNKAVILSYSKGGPWDKGGPSHLDPEIRGWGSVQKNFPAHRASVWSKNKGGGGWRASRAPPLDPPLLTKASWNFQRLQIYLGKVTFLSSRWPFISGRPTKAFHWWKAEKPPIFQGDVSRTLRMFNILKIIQPVYPFSPTQTFWGVRYARVPTHFSLFLVLLGAPKPVLI